MQNNTLPYFARTLEFFDQESFQSTLQEKSKIPAFKQAIQTTFEQFDRQFKEGVDVSVLVFNRATFIDCILHYAWHQYEWQQQNNLIAVGGYGRGELHPYSDIDLLLLVSDDQSDSQLESTAQFFTFLWDIGLEIGHSVRTVQQCVEMAETDITVATCILESRTLLGDPSLFTQLNNLTTPDKIWSADDFFLAKREEQKVRHKRFRDSEYNLEPNIKNAPGGLRDIQIICWVAKRFFNVSTLKNLHGQNFFTDEEFQSLESGENFLWRVRYGLHMIAKRPEERLLFDHQRELAKLFGFVDTDERLAVEQFMHQYYRQVMELRVLNDVLLQFLYEVILQKNNNNIVKPINKSFQLRNNFIEATGLHTFENTPSALIEIFVLMAENENIEGIRASTIRLVRESLHLIDDKFRKNPENIRLFLALFEHPDGLAEQLKRMIRYGILGLYLPEFEHTIGQMQHDLFHIYTVDAHTLRVVQNLCNFLREEAAENFPISTGIVKKVPNLPLLFLAGLFHDIGKGLGGNHSTLGSKTAKTFCENHNISLKDTHLLCWLVEKHLLMSSVSQRQDISDPDVIHNFALVMGDQLHLDYLFALTVADINATNPNLWTPWRASLMRNLYIETKRALRRGLENKVDKQEWIDETQNTAMANLANFNITQAQCWSIWENVNEDYFLRESHTDIEWHTEAIFHHDDAKPLVLVQETSNKELSGATQIFVRTKALKNVFSTLVTALDRLNLSIQDARIYKSTSEYLLQTFFVLNQNDENLNTNDLARIKQILLVELEQTNTQTSIGQRLTPRRLKHFNMPTRTTIQNDISGDYTLLEVITPDRPGLLACINRIFIKFNIQLQNAKISTLGERVEDIFFISNINNQPLNDPQLCSALQHEICSQLDERVDQSVQ